MSRPGYVEVMNKLLSFKENGGLKAYDIKDLVLPHKDIHGLAADFGKDKINDDWNPIAKKNSGNKIEYVQNDTPVKTAQIRKIFNEIKRLYITYEEDKSIKWNKLQEELILIIPKIMFAKSRGSKKLLGSQVKNLGDIFIVAIEACIKGNDDKDKEENFIRLYQLMESFVAYHRQYAGDKEG